MSEQSEPLQRIEAYVDRQMTPEEKAAFEQEMTLNPALRQQTRQVQESILTLRALAREAEKDSLRTMYQEVSATPRARVLDMALRPRTWLYAAAAAVLVLIVARISFSPRPDAVELYGRYFEPYPAERFRGGNDTSYRAAALQLYSEKNYAAAIPLLRGWSQKEPENETPLLYLAVSDMERGEHTEAIVLLTHLMAGKEFQEPARWYLALQYVKLGQSEKALPLLEEISGRTVHYRRAEATKLLKTLK
ncbi:MAG: hypothetical protein EAZ89_21320 [Bacteroidetes bacterium]|nr:MAG: hypothetical protein EAZ89_21320 [Bacteroidota bacterium]